MIQALLAAAAAPVGSAGTQTMLWIASAVSTWVMVVAVNTWNEAIRLAAILLRRLRDFDERGVKAYFTRECYHFDVNWHFDPKAVKCIKSWHIRAIITIASAIHPLVKAYGAKTMESVVNDADITKIDVREDLLRDLSGLIYEEVINHVTGNVRSAAASNDAVISRIINQGIGDLMMQIQRIEALMRSCRDGAVRIGEEVLDCSELWSYDAYLHQTLESLKKLAKKYNVSVELDRKPWWLYE